MPEIARFYGILIKMFFSPKEHNPPHIHAIYGEYSGEFELNTLQFKESDLPKNAQRLVLEWAKQHKAELLKMWEEKQIKKLPPLE